MTHQLATGRMAMLRKIIIAGLSKVGAVLLAFISTVLITRLLSGEEAGKFFLGLSVIAVLSVTLRLGLDKVILRAVSAEGVRDSTHRLITSSIFLISFFSVIVSSLVFVFSQPISIMIFNKPSFEDTLELVALITPVISIYFIVSMIYQAQHKVVVASVFQNLGISFMFVMLFFCIYYFSNITWMSESAMMLYVVSASVVGLCALMFWVVDLKLGFGKVVWLSSSTIISAFHLWVASLASLVVQWAGVLVLGILESSINVALYSAANRIALLIGFVLLVVNMVVGPRFARIAKANDMYEMRKLSIWSSRLMLLFCIPMVVVVLICPSEIMFMFGEEYAEASGVLVILALGQLVNVATGSVGLILNMCGFDKEYNYTILVSSVVMLFLIVGFTFEYGILGAAIGTALGVVLQSIMLITVVKMKLGFAPIG